MDITANDIIKIEFFRQSKIHTLRKYEDPNRLETENLIGIVLSVSEDCLICAGKTRSRYYNRFRVEARNEILNLLEKNTKKKFKYFIQDIKNLSNPHIKSTQNSSFIQKDRWYIIEDNSNLDKPKIKDIETEHNVRHLITDDTSPDELLSAEISGNNSKLSCSIDSARYYSEDLDNKDLNIMEHLQAKKQKIYSISNQ